MFLVSLCSHANISIISAINTWHRERALNKVKDCHFSCTVHIELYGCLKKWTLWTNFQKVSKRQLFEMWNRLKVHLLTEMRYNIHNYKHENIIPKITQQISFHKIVHESNTLSYQQK